jgi:hypothetical protein
MANTCGVIVGVDAHHEWMFPWWWKNYSRYNSYPVAFADFGLSLEQLKWCHERGIVISIPEISLSSEKDLMWEQIYGPSIWQARKHWFKKPSALLASSFNRGLWIDIDCEVCGSLSPLFEEFKDATFAVAREKREIFYNSGVVLFKKETPLLQKWQQLCLEQNGRVFGVQKSLYFVVEVYYLQ